MTTNPYKIFLVDDDSDLCEVMMEIFESEQISAKAFQLGSEMLKELDPEWNGVVISDLHMPEMDGFELLEESNKIAPGVPFIVITGYGDVDSALKAVRNGAYDFLEKPATPDHVLSVIRRALKMRQLDIENTRFKRKSSEAGDIVHRLLGRSQSIRDVRKTISELAQTNLNVLIQGEKGTGKSLIASILHDCSSYQGEFVHLKSIDLIQAFAKGVEFSTLIEKRFENLSKIGTLFIEDINDVPLEMQLQLLLQMQMVKWERVLFSVQKEPSDLMEEGVLCSQLYFGLSLTPFKIPPIRARSKDAFLLLEHFIRQSAVTYQRKLPFVSEDEINLIKYYPWPGNVAEIRIVAERSVLGMKLTLDNKQNFSLVANLTYDEAVAKFERDLISSALSQSAGRKGRAAKILGITRKRLYLKMKTHNLVE